MRALQRAVKMLLVIKFAGTSAGSRIQVVPDTREKDDGHACHQDAPQLTLDSCKLVLM